MELRLKDLSKRLKQLIFIRQEAKDNLISGRTQNRVLELIYRCKKSNENGAIGKNFDLINEYIEGVATTLVDKDEPTIVESLAIAESVVLDILITELRLPSVIKTQILEKVRSSVEYPQISTYLPKFLFYYTEHEQKKKQGKEGEITFMDFQYTLRQIMNEMGERFTYFSKQIAKKYICNNVTEDEYTLRIQFSKVETFYELFFGSKTNFKFYGIVNRLTRDIGDNIVNNYAVPLNLTCTRPRVAYKGKNEVMPKGQISILPTGLQFGRNNPILDDKQEEIRMNTYRNDNLVVIGKHFECDIRLPSDDPMTDWVSFVLINMQDNYYMIDCSKKIPCYFKIFEQFPENAPPVPTELKQGHLFNFAKTMNFLVQKIEFKDRDQNMGIQDETYRNNYDEVLVDSTMTLKFYETPYQGHTFMLKTKIYKNETDFKTIHNVGSGGDPRGAPDIFIPKERGVSALHAQFEYNPSTKYWGIRDIESRNGTFRLMKTEEQFSNKRPSLISKVFGGDYDSQGMFMTFSVSNYTFFLIKKTD